MRYYEILNELEFDISEIASFALFAISPWTLIPVNKFFINYTSQKEYIAC